MKKIFTILSLFALSTGVFAQHGDIPNATTLNLSWFRPTGSGINFSTPGGTYHDAHSDDISYARANHNGISFGGSIGVGGMYFINKLDFVDGLRLGINAEYFEISANGLYAEYQNSGEVYADVHAKLSPKVGLQLTYAPLEFMKMDIYMRWAPMVGINYHIDEEYFYYDANNTYEGINMEYALKRISMGFNYRISVVIIGIEYIKGLTNTYIQSPYNDLTSKYSFADNTLKVTLGFNFDKD